MFVYLIIISLANQDNPERCFLDIIDYSVFTNVITQKRVPLHLLRIVWQGILHQRENLFYDLPKLFGRQVIQELL